MENENFQPFEFVLDEPKNGRLGAGSHRVTIDTVKFLYSTDPWGEAPAEERKNQFNDKTPQVGMLFKGEGGTHIQRFNTVRYVRYSELLASPEKYPGINVKHYESAGEQGFAMHSKDRARIVDTNDGGKARELLYRVGKAAGVTGQTAMACQGKKIILVLEEKPYQGKAKFDFVDARPWVESSVPSALEV